MSLLLPALVTMAFAITYALVAAMIGERAPALLSALTGRPRQPAQAAAASASRRFILA
jgi:hypothetical protein